MQQRFAGLLLAHEPRDGRRYVHSPRWVGLVGAIVGFIAEPPLQLVCGLVGVAMIALASSAPGRHSRLRSAGRWLLAAIALSVVVFLVARRGEVVPTLFRYLTPHDARIVSPVDAVSHVGEYARVCGAVASANVAATSAGSPTFLNLGRPYPNQDFTAVVWRETRALFERPPETLEGKDVCVSGTITIYDGKAQIVVRDPAQIEAAPPRETGFFASGGKKYRVHSDGRLELVE